MINFEDECCNCCSPLYPCIGSSCKNKNVPHFYCDECGEEDMLFHFDNEQLCMFCIKQRLEQVKWEDW